MSRYHKLGFLRALILFSCLLFTLPAHALLEAIIGEKFPFTVQINGHEELAKQAANGLRTQRKESIEFKNYEQLRAAARFDRDILEKWMRSQGYFAAKVDTELQAEHILYRVDPGPLYPINKITIHLPEGIELPDSDAFAVHEGDPLNAELVLDSVDALKKYVLDNYCLYEVIANYEAEINHATHQAFLTLTVQPSPSVQFADTTIDNLKTVQRPYLNYYFTFSKGDCFRRKEVELTRLALLQTNLFSRINVEIGPPKDGQVSVTFDATERHHRTLKAGVGYDTNTGKGFTVGWEHRNLRHRGQRLTVDSHISDVKQNVLGELTIPHFIHKNQTLTLHSEFEKETTDAYEVTKADVGADIERPLYKHLSGSIGTALEYSRIFDPTNQYDGDDGRDNFTLLSFPMHLDYLNNNNPLNPTRGWGLGLATEPFVDMEDTGKRFVKSTLAASTYLTAAQLPLSPTLALRIATGSISNASLQEVPAVHRFYVGGGGSVRGYSYQAVGDLNEDQIPLGGLSFSETSLELRLRFSNTWGAVLFADGGYAYPERNPSFSRDLLWGAGIGIRYFTSFAPIRFDIATPLDRRRDSEGKHIDDSIQLYINIGQSF